MNEYQVAVVAEQVRQLNESVKELKADIGTLRAELSEMYVMANRWKGGFVVLVGLGGVVGWLVSVGVNIKGFFH